MKYMPLNLINELDISIWISYFDLIILDQIEFDLNLGLDLECKSYTFKS